MKWLNNFWDERQKHSYKLMSQELPEHLSESYNLFPVEQQKSPYPAMYLLISPSLALPHLPIIQILLVGVQ